MSLDKINGVFCNGIASGIRSSGRLDLAYIYVPDAVASAGVFTQNRFVAAPVSYTRKLNKKATIKAMIINSGNANCGTGDTGVKDAEQMSQLTADQLALSAKQVGVASTGGIGRTLPMETIKRGIPQLLSNPKVQNSAAIEKAILTTDLVEKSCYKTAKIGEKEITVAGISKGSGMIEPNMATMLGFLATDADLSKEELAVSLKAAVELSFNSISVDTDTSTNDMVMMWATGEHQFKRNNAEQLEQFQSLLNEVCIDLAQKIARDGEGATKLVEVTVKGAHDDKQAKQMAKSIVNSPLVKTAIYGADPNWGRVLAAAGKNPELKMNFKKVDIAFAGVAVMRKGKIMLSDLTAVQEKLKKETVKIEVNVNIGEGTATVWGCDLTHGYIDINVDYS